MLQPRLLLKCSGPGQGARDSIGWSCPIRVGEHVAEVFDAVQDVFGGVDEVLGLVAGADLVPGDGGGYGGLGAAA